MEKILDNIDTAIVEKYVDHIFNKELFFDDPSLTIQDITQFLDWAYDKNYLSFFKYQQLKDIFDNGKNKMLSEQPEEYIEQTPMLRNRKPQYKQPDPDTHTSNHFLVKHAYIFFPLITGVTVLLLYIYIQSTSQTISPVQLSSIVTKQSPLSTASRTSYILNYQDELKDEFGIPVKDSTSLRFRLYQGPNTLESVYDTATGPNCLVKPLIDGSVQVDIGRACGEPIPGSLFASNSYELWLGVTIGTNQEIQPRKKIILTAQGLAIDTSASSSGSGTADNDVLNELTGTSNNTDRIIQSSNSAHIRLLAGSTQAIDISPNGNVGINKDNPETKLDVGGDTTINDGNLNVKNDKDNLTVAKIQNTNKSDNADGVEVQLGYDGNGSAGNSYVIFKNGISRIQGRIHSNQNGGVSYATSGSDFAEYFKKDLTTSYNQNSFSPGTLICYSNQGVSPCNTTSKYILGAISDNPGFIGGAELHTDDQYALVGLVGQLHIKVYNDGNIKPGDALTISTHEGYAEKAYQKSYIIGYALEQPTEKGFTTIKTHIQPSLYDPFVYYGLSGNDKSSYLAHVSNTVQTLVADLIEATTAKIQTLYARVVHTDTLVAETIDSPQIKKIENSVNNLQNKTEIQTYIASDNSTDTDISTIQTSAKTDSPPEVSSTSENTQKTTTIQTNSTDAGEGYIRAGEKSVIIFNKNVQPQTLVYLTSTSPSQNSTIYIAEKGTCASKNIEQSTLPSRSTSDLTTGCQPYFKVSIDKPIDSEITFNWWVVNE